MDTPVATGRARARAGEVWAEGDLMGMWDSCQPIRVMSLLGKTLHPVGIRLKLSVLVGHSKLKVRVYQMADVWWHKRRTPNFPLAPEPPS